MAPNYAIYQCYGRTAQIETFLMSNVCPQFQTNNDSRTVGYECTYDSRSTQTSRVTIRAA